MGVVISSTKTTKTLPITKPLIAELSRAQRSEAAVPLACAVGCLCLCLNARRYTPRPPPPPVCAVRVLVLVLVLVDRSWWALAPAPRVPACVPIPSPATRRRFVCWATVSRSFLSPRTSLAPSWVPAKPATPSPLLSLLPSPPLSPSLSRRCRAVSPSNVALSLRARRAEAKTRHCLSVAPTRVPTRLWPLPGPTQSDQRSAHCSQPDVAGRLQGYPPPCTAFRDLSNDIRQRVTDMVAAP
jgi:hypothetical protein